MIRYTTKYINIISLIITITITFFFNNIKLNQIDFKKISISNPIKKDTVHVEMKTENTNQQTQENNKTETQDNQQKSAEEQIKKTTQESTSNKTTEEWKIIIPKISLEAEIAEGTSQETMNKYVGHFSETALKEGNIGLAAHNRGYAVNYFAEIKNLGKGDKIIYKYKGSQKTYIVERNKIIKDTDWSYLEKTEDNRITLITCVENEPEYRRCIQATEYKEVDQN